MPSTNSIEWVEWDDVPLSHEEAEAVVDSVYIQAPGEFRLYGVMERKHRRYHGLQRVGFDGVHEVYLNPEDIAKTVRDEKKCYAGNIVRCPNVRLAVGLVLVHELQHCNQQDVHGRTNRAFWGQPFRTYKGRACEREARQRADDMREVVAAILKVPSEEHKFGEHTPDELRERDLRDIADVFAEAGDRVSKDDVREELRRVGLNNPVYFARFRGLLDLVGVDVVE